jgi:sec-independent protein translocase protein TatA
MDIGVPELLIILAIVIVLFGPSRLSGLGRSLGQGIREFRQSVRGQERPAGEPAPSSEEALER